MSNKSQGNTFEKEFSELLSQEGFWSHVLQDNKNGQPADIIASKDGKTYLIDCKDCMKDCFELRRMEENQINAMSLFRECGNGWGWFAVQLEKTIWMLHMPTLIRLKENGIKALYVRDMKKYGFILKDWLELEEIWKGI